MRRVLFVLIFLVAVGGGLGWWFYVRMTPEKYLAAAFRNLASEQGVQTLQASVFWDVLDASGSGYVLGAWLSFSGSVNAKDLTHIGANGIVGYSKTGSAVDFQTADVAVTADTAAFRLRDSEDGLRAWFESSAATTTATSTWYGFDRDVLLKEKQLDRWISVGNASDVRNAFRSVGLEGWASPVKTGERRDGNVRVIVTDLSLHRDEIERGLISLMAAWMLKNPDVRDLDWARRAAAGAANGTWTAEIDASTRTFRAIRGTWPLQDADGRTVGHVNAEFVFRNFGPRAAVRVPEGFVDVTDAIRTKRPGSFAPAQERQDVPPEEPAESADTGAQTATTSVADDAERLQTDSPDGTGVTSTER